MTLIDRLSTAYQSQIGTLLVALLIFLALLGLVYWLLLWRQKKRDICAYLYRSHYEKAESWAKELGFMGGHKSDFFGRLTPVKLPTGKRGFCLIPPPDLAEEDIRDKFRCFSRALESVRPPLIAPWIWKHDEESLIMVQGHLTLPDGKALLNLKHYLFDNKLTQPDKEKILFNIARALAGLHEISAEVGGKLYHGFLLPRSIYLDFDATYNIRKIVVADTGLAFSLGPAKLHQRLIKLREGALPVERFCAHEILEHMSMLAPEQKNGSPDEKVGPSVDFFAYAALAVVLFTKKKFNGVQTVNWEAIPPRWHSFLKASLQEAPEKRPQDFLELEDWLNDPELALTNQTNEVRHEPLESVEESNTSLSEMMHRIQKNPSHIPADKGEHLNKLFEAGAKAMHGSKWELASQIYREALSLFPDNAEVHVKLAIAYYECGDLKQAEFFYQKAKQSHPKLAKAFREHIAFKV